MQRRVVSVLAIVALLLIEMLSLAGCTSCSSNIKVTGLEAIHETEFGNVYLSMTIDEFNEAGFEYGDSVKITFSNGYVLDDLPYYNGFYTHTGEPLLVAYPGYPYIRAGFNAGDDLWVVAGLEEGDTADVELVERGAYKAIQNARDITYSDERDEYPSDEAFANFREVTVGDIQPGVLYRAASPCNNYHLRAPYVDDLIEEAGVAAILNLADTEEKIEGYIEGDDFDSPYFLSLYEDGKVVVSGLSMNYESDDFKATLADGLVGMTEMDGPYLVHCNEGKDRTGFACMLLEALCGASYQEIVDDYMVTYDNYYGITTTEQKEKYDVIVSDVLDPMIQSMLDDEDADLASADLAAGAKAWLLDAGMSEAQVNALKARLVG